MYNAVSTALLDMVVMLLNFENTPDTVSLGEANIVRWAPQFYFHQRCQISVFDEFGAQFNAMQS